jgi:hypothetical protein
LFKLWFILSTMSDIYSKPNAISGSIPCKYCKRLTSFHDDLPDTDWRRECCSRSCYDTWQANKGTPGKVEEKDNNDTAKNYYAKCYGCTTYTRHVPSHTNPWYHHHCTPECYDKWLANQKKEEDKGTPGKVEEKGSDLTVTNVTYGKVEEVKKTPPNLISNEVTKKFGYFGTNKNMYVELKYDGITNKRTEVKVFRKENNEKLIGWTEDTYQEFVEIMKQADKM